ncbi:MAG: hypothetical protein K6G23_11050, partial [Lachnospiraceae bacterium]|nr:hypothetical protein [Lachnospiraceae bacterium]
MTSATDQTQLTLAEIFQDGMIFQRNEPIRIWGTAPAAGLILTTITDKNGTILADSQSSLSHAGAFMITLPALTAAEGLSLRVTFAEQQLLLQDLAIGDVWLAGGQSNMEFFLKYDRDF